ncbi:velvet factor-domain-containing protein [Glomus cerebriforme]|uniref:Velvet factor-domain-containing protein n=1 Tax=Glomus cerebriforme TaxID=658196 RepID=A0A397T6Y2_9GLOM|nr:velvet factor-domain-containing protein [Glomus cerebriforme]
MIDKYFPNYQHPFPSSTNDPVQNNIPSSTSSIKTYYFDNFRSYHPPPNNIDIPSLNNLPSPPPPSNPPSTNNNYPPHSSPLSINYQNNNKIPFSSDNNYYLNNPFPSTLNKDSQNNDYLPSIGNIDNYQRNYYLSPLSKNHDLLSRNNHYHHSLKNDFQINNYPRSINYQRNNYHPSFSKYRLHNYYHPIYPNYGQMFLPAYKLPPPRIYRRRVDNELYDQTLQYATKDIMNAPMEPGTPKLNYKLEVVQQPIRARMCGFGEKDRRPISPLPFLRLKINDEKGPIDIHKIDPGFFVVYASIFVNKSDQEAMLVKHPSSMPGNPVCVNNLVGEKTAQGKRLFDMQGNEDIWFIFRDLSVRAEGEFYMKFTLMHIGWQGLINTSKIPFKTLVSTCSDPFIVYTAKRFPGMIESTPLTRYFVLQGNKIPIRRDPAKRFLNELDNEILEGDDN